MSLHPPAPTDFAGAVDAWAQTVQSVLDLGRTLRPGDEGHATDCPGWTVFDQVAHVASAEAAVAGDPVPDLDVSGHAHVRHAFGARMERLVESRRGRTLDDLLDELEWRLAERLAAYRAEGVTGEEEVEGPFGPTRLVDLVAVRTFDVWMHEQDLREALERPGGLDGPAAATSVAWVFRQLPRVVAKDAGIEPGNAVVLDLTGPTVGRVGARVEEQDGRAVGIPLFIGEDVEHPDVVTTTLSMSTRVAMRLAGGRRAPEDLPVTVSGDDDVARRVLAALAITP
ncbi:maleylpyruvate isomerase family mycothiol-dependent enzyme [Phycicoccus sonneratiae]|uniref:Maleylpyruvate isomerase family mycothiol-dependent enzyme n=1 Tax=Phycicoccus sonneratiae TaxID=2807628 RepID=A0ABS2CP31_9MICO|nr:maleylpyruvate isomerase family mycothiol-dependent enzyme [Phycicoccus sonneraticus]MBM6401629.1 maleylpyruvate isomerase family mycothiol-dependent enzyme [Phycicoccus sonneraticus]